MSETPEYPPLSPSLVVNDGAAALQFYKKAFGAKELYRLVDPQSGKIGHAEFTINGALVMLADEYPELTKAPTTLGGNTVSLGLTTTDAKADFDRAVNAGALVVKALTEQFYGHLAGRVRDPFGHEWIISQELEKIEPEEMQRRWDALAKGAK